MNESVLCMRTVRRLVAFPISRATPSKAMEKASAAGLPMCIKLRHPLWLEIYQVLDMVCNVTWLILGVYSGSHFLQV